MKNDLAARRLEREWTQADLATTLGVSRQTVISIERGRFDPSLPLAFLIARTFGCTIEDIFTPDRADAEGDSRVPVSEFAPRSPGSAASKNPGI
jgi:putative transcriptional regulator